MTKIPIFQKVEVISRHWNTPFCVISSFYGKIDRPLQNEHKKHVKNELFDDPGGKFSKLGFYFWEHPRAGGAASSENQFLPPQASKFNLMGHFWVHFVQRVHLNQMS